MPSFDISYTYDAAGNRLTKTDNQTSEVTTYSYDGANRLLSETDSLGTTNYEYDADGNRTKKETPSTTTFYEWDQENRLVEVEPVAGTVTLAYNGDGQRVKKETPSETTKFIYDFKTLLQETDGNDETQHLFTSTNEEYGDLVSEFGDGSSSYFQYDALGSADALLDADETATDRYQYQAFGLQDHTSGSSENRFTFVGRQNYYRDSELELYMLGMGNSDGGGRPYDPAVGAFVSQDPIEDDTNLYRYAGNNPVNAVDPSGHKNTSSKTRAALVVWAWRRRELTDFEFRDAYLAWTKAGDPAVGVVNEMLRQHHELEYLKELIREKSAQEHARRLQQQYGRHSVPIVLPWLDEDAPQFPDSSAPAWLRESPGYDGPGESTPQAPAPDSAPSIEQRIEETRAFIRDAQKRIEGVCSLNTTVVASVQRSKSSYYNACIQRRRKRLGELLRRANKLADEGDIDSEEYVAAMTERGEIFDACEAEAKRLFAANREFVKSVSKEYREEEEQILQEIQVAQDRLAALEDQLNSGAPLTADFRTDEEKAARKEAHDRRMEDYKKSALEIGTEYVLAFIPIPPPLKLGAARAARLLKQCVPAPVRQLIKSGVTKGKEAVKSAITKTWKKLKSLLPGGKKAPKPGSTTPGPKLLPGPPPGKTIKHHIFNKFRGKSPKSQKYRDFFKKHGIEVDEFTVEMPETFHKGWIHKAGQNWTTRWKQWIDANPNATTKEVYQQAGRMMDEYGISHLPLAPY